jgi:hypothetical protein
MFRADRIRGTVFWANAALAALSFVMAVLTNMPAHLLGAFFWSVAAIFWRSELPFQGFTDVLLRRVNLGIMAAVLLAIVVASAADMENASRAVANMALCAAVVAFALRLWRECRT